MVVLINAKTEWFGNARDIRQWPINLNLGLLGLGSELIKRGISIIIRDQLSDPIKDNEIVSNNIFIISVDFNSVKSAIETTKKIIHFNKTAKVIWGSYGRGFFGKFTNSFPGFALDVTGVFAECYNTNDTINLVESIIKNKYIEYLNSIDNKKVGISFWKNNKKILGNTKLEKTIYYPDYTLVDMEKYIYRTALEISDDKNKLKKVVPIITGDGCPFRCTFCINSSQNVPYRPAKIEDIINAIDYLNSKYNLDLIWFQDDNLFANKTLYEAIFQHIIKKNYKFKWAAQGSLIYLKNIPNETLKTIMKNCYWLGVGFENYNKEVRNKLGKVGITNDDLWNLVRLAKKYNFEIAISFIVGTPEETIKDIINTAKFIFDIKRFYSKFSITYQLFSHILIQKCIMKSRKNIQTLNYPQTFSNMSNKIRIRAKKSICRGFLKLKKW